MNAIQNWASALCYAAVLIAFCRMICKHCAAEKTIHILLGLFFLCAVLSPALTHLDFSLDSLTPDAPSISSSDLEQRLREQTLKLSGRNLEISLQSLLEENQYPYEKITVLMDTKEDQSIVISRIVIVLRETDMKNKEVVEKLVREQTGVAPQIVSETGGESLE